MPGPSHIVFMRFVGEDGRRDEEDGAVVKLAGEIVARGTICDIVALVSHAMWRGELVVLDGLTSRSVFFEQGNVIGAQSTATGERLGEVLYQFGALTTEQVEQCMAMEGKRVGDAAVELGFLTREKLYQLMGKQVEEIVYKTLLVGDGMFYFLDRYDESRLMSRYNLSANSLLMEGVRRMDEMSYFRERVPSENHVPSKVQGKSDPSEKTDKDVLKVWQAINGELSVEELGRACEMSLFDTTRAVFQLCSTGHVQIRAPKLNDPGAVVEVFNASIRMIIKAAKECGHGDELKANLASFASGSGIYDALFLFAGPEEDGSVKAERVVTNIASLAGEDVITSLCQWLYDYAAFALFAAASLVPKEQEQILSRQVAELLSPLHQQRDDQPMSAVMPSQITINID
ncbi:MAG: DUF4388 domain-containing protein [Polyangiaceae bacterium]